MVVLSKRGEAARFFEQVAFGPSEGEGCIVWPYSCTGSGYPQMTRNAKNQFAHVEVCRVHHGDPRLGEEVRHSCGVARCIAPWHLSWSDHLTNMRDRIEHGTHNRGEQNPMWSGKLYESDVRKIKTALAYGARKSVLARHFGVSRQMISKIAHGQKWGWLVVNARTPCGPTGDDQFCACGCGGDDSRCDYWIHQYEIEEQVDAAHICCRIGGRPHD